MRTASFLIAVLSGLSLAGSLRAQCAEGAPGSCFEPHETAGCWTTECCDAVCDADVYCCDVSWDQYCVDYALEFCDGLACPAFQPCGETSPEPGCDDRICCRLVCDHDWFCCYVEWDELCVALQSSICGVEPCALEIPEGTPDEAEPCYERVNDGCNGIDRVFAPLGCGESVTGTVTTDGPRDTDWYAIELAETTTVTWRIRAEFPAQAVLVTGPCEGPLEALRLVETGDCGELLLEETLPPGAHRLVIAPGLEAMPVRGGIHCDLEDPEDPPEEPLEPSWFGLRYLITVECGATGPVGDLDGDGRVDGADLLIVLSRWDTDDPVADLDGSGTVDGADILQVLGAWTG